MKNALHIVGSFLLTAVFLSLSCERAEKQYVAIVDGEKISIEDFARRYTKYLDATSSRDNVLLRRRILENMVNERLIFQDLIRQGMDRDDDSRRRLEEIQLQALMDRYARSISADTVRVSEQELWNEFRVYHSRASARYLYARSLVEAWELKKLVDRGATFESLAKEIFEDPGLANNGGYLGYFGWGEMEPALEEAAFRLPVGQVSDPIRLRIGYAIVKVEDRVRNPLASESDYANVKEKLSHEVFHKKTERVLTDALDTITKNLAPHFNEEAVQRVSQNWPYLAQNIPGSRTEIRQGIPENIGSLELVRFPGDAWTVNDLLKKVEKITERQKRRVKTEQDVKDICLGLAAREILLDRARKAGLENDPVVRDQIVRVREEYLLKRWAASVQDTVGRNGWDESLLRQHFERQRPEYQFPPEVNVAEILVNTEPEAQEMMQRVKKGENFSYLARTYSLRLWAAKQGGELGFGTEADFGILGKKFFSSRVGQIIGPERVDPYHGVFKILGKREGRPKSFQEAREEIIQELTFNRRQEVFASAVRELRSRSTLSTNGELLADITLDRGQ